MLRLTVKERILLHLLDHAKASEAFEVPADVTQEGIAQATWTEVRHLAQYIRPLIREALVHERTGHVRGSTRRRKVYLLTDPGKLSAIRMRENLKTEKVRVRDGDLVQEATIAQLLEETKGRASTLAILRNVHQTGVVNIADFSVSAPPAFVETLSDMPRVETFVGRRNELDDITSPDGARLYVVRGVAGIGKTWLGAKACEHFRGTRNLFWHRVRPWDTRESVLSALGEFLAATGKPGLREVLRRGEVAGAGQVLQEDLPGTLAFLVFDDAHEASDATLQSFRLLVEAIADARDVRALILTRKALPFYGRRDVVLSALVKEIDLRGLQSGDVATYLFAAGVESKSLSAAKGLRGHPLFLELIRSRRAPPPSVLQDLHHYMEEEIYSTLSTPEREMMKVASVYRVPVPREALFMDSYWPHDLLLSLVDRSLIRSVGEERYEVHDAIREFFVGLLTAGERERCGAFTVEQLQNLASNASESKDLRSAVGYMENAAEIGADPRRRISIFARIGDLRRAIGDHPGALLAYRTILDAPIDLELAVSVHTRMADCLDRLGEFEEAERELAKARRLLPTGPSIEGSWALTTGAMVNMHFRRDYRKALSDLNRALDWTTKLPLDNSLLSFILLLRGSAHLLSGNILAAEADLKRAVDTALSSGDKARLCWAYVELAECYLEQGKCAETGDLIDRLSRILEEVGEISGRDTWLFLKAWYTGECLGQYEAAETLYKQVHHLAKRFHERVRVRWHDRHFADLYLRQGRVQEAINSLARFLDESKELITIDQRVENLTLMARLSLLNNDSQKATTSLREAQALSDSAGMSLAFFLEWARGAIEASQGQDKKAEASFQRAERAPLHLVPRGHTEEYLATPHNKGEFHLELGRFLASQGRRDEAEEVLRLAHKELTSQCRYPLAREAERARENLQPKAA